MAWVAIGLSVASVGAGIYGAVSASDSAAAAQKANAANVAATNQANLQQFEESRGSTGSALLPLYAKGGEAQLYQDTLNAYNNAGNLSLTPAQLQALVAQFQPVQAQANAAGAGIFNGQTQAAELANQVPVYQANLAAAGAQKQGTLEALQSTLNNIKAIQAGKGYAGDSFGNQLLNFQARQGANTTAANAFSQANIGNAQANQSIRQNAINRQLANLGLPGQMAQSNAALGNLAANTTASQQGQRQQLFNMFNIGNKGFTYQNLPQVNPIASVGQNVGQGLSTGASGLGNYFANQQLANQSQANNLALIQALQNGGSTNPYTISSGVPINSNAGNLSSTPVTSTDISPVSATIGQSAGDFGLGAGF